MVWRLFDLALATSRLELVEVTMKEGVSLNCGPTDQASSSGSSPTGRPAAFFLPGGDAGLTSAHGPSQGAAVFSGHRAVDF